MLPTIHAACLPTPLLPQEENWAKLQAAFEQEGSVQLQNFLTASWSEQVAAAVAAADAAAKAGRGQVPAYDAGICGGWQAAGPCHKQRYLRYAPAAANGGDGEGAAAASAVGGVLAQIRDELFATAAFARLLTKVGGGMGGCLADACWLGCRLLAPAMCIYSANLLANPTLSRCHPPCSSRPLGWRGSRARCGASARAWTTQWRTTAC